MAAGAPRENEAPGPERPFDIHLPFSLAECSGCGEPAEQGPCPRCGEGVPRVDDRHVAARRGAFAPLAERARESKESFAALEFGGLPLSPEQFAAVVVESEVLPLAAQMSRLADDLTGVDLSDPKILGGEVRRSVERHLDRVDVLVERCRELARFAPSPDEIGFRQLVIDCGSYGAEVADALMQTLTAADLKTARPLADRAKALLEEFPLKERLDELSAELADRPPTDLSGRIAIAIGRPGDFVGEQEEPDLGRILAAFADEDEPFPALERRARAYFAPLIHSVSEGGSGAMLILPLILLAVAERPLLAHRACRRIFEALQEAAIKDRPSVEVLVRRSTAQGPVVYAALERIDRAMGMLRADSSEAAALDSFMQAYRHLSESAFRMAGWLAVGTDLILSGRELPPESHPPMLGELQDRLRAGGPASNLLAEGIDPALRNAEAHSQYRWVADREVAKDLRTGQEWSVEELQGAAKALVSVVAGIDAGYACFIVVEDIDQGVPDWMEGGDAPAAHQILAMLCFAPYGHRVIAIRDSGATVVIEEPEDPDPARLFPSLAGMSTLAPGADAYRVLAPNERALVDFEASAVRRVIDAPESLRGLEVMACTFESYVRIGGDPQRLGRDFAIVLVKVAAFAGLRELKDAETTPPSFRDLGDRLLYSGAVIKKRIRIPDRDVLRAASRLGRARDLTLRASRGDGSALSRLVKELGSLCEWADEEGVHWPPKHRDPTDRGRLSAAGSGAGIDRSPLKRS